jgi:tyrosyl-tRNA synthetase
MTITLLTDSNGKKMGKTAGNAVWLDPNKTSPFEFYQYWRNVGDADVMKCIKMLTFLPLEEIEAMEAWDDSRINEKKEVLAYELTALVHGTEEADKAKETSRNLFSGGGNSADMPTTEIEESALTDGKIGVLDLMVAGKLAPSRSEAKRLVIQGGVVMNDEKVAAFSQMVEADALRAGVVIRKGKKVYHKFILK